MVLASLASLEEESRARCLESPDGGGLQAWQAEVD